MQARCAPLGAWRRGAECRRCAGYSLLRSFQTPLAFTNSESAKTFYVFGGVVSPPARGASRKWQRSEPFAKSEPACGDAEKLGGFANRVLRLLLEHTGATINL